MTVRTADGGADEARHIRHVLASAFSDDPFFCWLFPDSATRATCTAALMMPYVEAYLSMGVTDIVGDGSAVLGAALWAVPNTPEVVLTGLPDVGDLLHAICGEQRLSEAIEAYDVFVSVRPSEAFAYLHFVGTSPAERGRGYGRSLVRHGVARAEAAGLPVHLETNAFANLTFYRSLGFRVTAHKALPHGAPDLWALRLDPR